MLARTLFEMTMCFHFIFHVYIINTYNIRAMASADELKREFYKKLLVLSGKKAVATKNNELYKTPKKDKVKEIPRNRNITPNAIYQADVLYMPEDKGFKFMLVVVDSAHGKTDAIPMTQATQLSTIEAFKKAFNGKYLKTPSDIQVDAGKEFTGETLKYLNDKKIMVKVSKVARSRQVSYAESRNKTLAKALFMRMTAQELLTDQLNK